MKKLIFPILIFCVLLLAAFMLLSRPEQKPVITKDSTDSATTILTELQSALGIKGELQVYGYMDWIDEKDMSLPLSGKQFFVGSINMKGVKRYDAIPVDNMMAITATTLAPLITQTDAYFSEKSFTKNEKNTRVVTSLSGVINFYGYEKGATKCVVKLNEQQDPFGYYVCGEIDREQIEMQKPFTSLFIGTQYFGDTINSFRIQKVDGDYAMGSANGYSSGYTWMAGKSAGKWTVLWTGQEIPMCTDMQKQGIPESLYGNCYTADEANGQ